MLPPWPSTLYRYSTSGASLPDALQALSQATQVPIAFDPSLPGRVEGRFDMSAQRFLDVLARAYRLVWYYDGTVLHVDAASAQKTLIVRLNYASRAAFHRLLVQTGIDDVRFTARDDAPSRGLITFRGPPAWIALVGGAARQLDADARARVKTAVRVVPLHYGSSADRTAFANDRANVVRGVASRAAQLLDPDDALREDVTEYEAPLPVLSADARTNAVLVKDRPARLDADVRAIEALDRPEQRVAIGLLVAEGDTATFRTLGLGAQGTTVVRAPAASELAAALRAAPTLQRVADSELQTVDGAVVAWARRAERPVAAARTRSASIAAPDSGTRTPGAATGPSRAQARAQAADGALRILPTVDARGKAPHIVLAAEWRGATIDVARAALAPGDALVMVEPVGPTQAAGQARSRVILLVPYAIGGGLAGDPASGGGARVIRPGRRD